MEVHSPKKTLINIKNIEDLLGSGSNHEENKNFQVNDLLALSPTSSSFFDKHSDNISDDLVFSSKKIHKDDKKKYQNIPNELRLSLVNAVNNNKEKIKHAAKRLGINYSSAKYIYQVYKKEGRCDKQLFKRKKKLEASFPEISKETAFPSTPSDLVDAQTYNFAQKKKDLALSYSSFSQTNILNKNDPSKTDNRDNLNVSENFIPGDMQSTNISNGPSLNIIESQTDNKGLYYDPHFQQFQLTNPTFNNEGIPSTSMFNSNAGAPFICANPQQMPPYSYLLVPLNPSLTSPYQTLYITQTDSGETHNDVIVLENKFINNEQQPKFYPYQYYNQQQQPQFYIPCNQNSINNPQNNRIQIISQPVYVVPQEITTPMNSIPQVIPNGQVFMPTFNQYPHPPPNVVFQNTLKPATVAFGAKNASFCRN